MVILPYALRMKIQLQNIFYYPRIGGVETHTQYSAEYFIRHGDTATVLCSKHLPSQASEEIINGVPVTRHKDYRLFPPFSVFNPLYHVKRVESFIGNNPPDADVIWAGHPYYALASRRALPEMPVVFFHSTLYATLLKYNYKNYSALVKTGFRLWNFQNTLIENTLLSQMDAVVVLSQSRKRETLDFIKGQSRKIFVNPAGVDTEKFRPRPKDMQLMEEFRLPSDSRIILSACRLSPEKNLEWLLHAFSMIQDADTYLVIVGDGIERPHLEKLAGTLNILHRVRFAGFRDDIARFYTVADVFVLPSIYEGFGLVYLEAMASGVPCIGLKANYPDIIVATEEIIQDGVTGYCVDPQSVPDLTDKIRALLFNPDLRRTMSVQARDLCQKKYTWDQHILTMQEIMRGVI